MAIPQRLEVRGTGADLCMMLPLKLDSNYCAASAGGAAVSLTLAADAARPGNIFQIISSYSAAPTGGRLSISDGSNTLFDIDIVASGPLVINWPVPVCGGPNVTLTVTLAAPGGAIVGKLNILAFALT
jgi:hypothetical protein